MPYLDSDWNDIANENDAENPKGQAMKRYWRVRLQHERVQHMNHQQ